MLALAVLGVLALAGVVAWKVHERRERYRRPFARIPGAAVFGRFVAEDRLILLRPGGHVEVWRVGEGEPRELASHDERWDGNFSNAHGWRHAAPVEVQPQSGSVVLRSLETGEAVATVCFDPNRRGVPIAAAFSPRREVAAIAWRDSKPGDRVGRESVEVRTLRSDRVRRIDLGSVHPDGSPPWFVFEPSLARVHSFHAGKWSVFALLDGQELATRELPPGLVLEDWLSTGELLCGQAQTDGDALHAYDPATGKLRLLADRVSDFDTDAAGESLFFCRESRRVVLDVATGRERASWSGAAVPSAASLRLVVRRRGDTGAFEGAVSPSGERVAFEGTGEKEKLETQLWLVPREGD